MSSVDTAGLKLTLFLICNSKGQSKQKIRIKSLTKLTVASWQFHPQGAAGRSRLVTGVTQALSQAPGEFKAQAFLAPPKAAEPRPKPVDLIITISNYT